MKSEDPSVAVVMLAQRVNSWEEGSQKLVNRKEKWKKN
jgi:hypothetical protein